MSAAICRVAARLLLLAIAVLLPACKSIDPPKVPGITPYRMVIQQGNFISQEMVSQLKPGMTKDQVRFVLGTPLVTDIFHADRWDYVFFRELPNGNREQRNLSVIFEKDKLARVLGDLLPAEGSAPQSSGFEPLVKPEAPAKSAAKPDAEAPKPAAESPKPEASKAAAEPTQPAQAAQNWGTAESEKKAEAAPAPKPEESKPAEEEKKEPGWLDRLREKIGL
ncbi:MAG TPA: outer membrane protein assembly factor BamE [Burkholderiales bacterium]|nr:outer membrane protein assembly factor BamE [Burkholderiales bacterium]